MKLEVDKKNDKIILHLEEGAAKGFANLIKYAYEFLEEMATKFEGMTPEEMINAQKEQDNEHPDPPDADPISKNSG